MGMKFRHWKDQHKIHQERKGKKRKYLECFVIKKLMTGEKQGHIIN